MAEPTPVQEWIRVHRLLIEKEAAFTDIALKAAAGQLPLEELYRERELLMEMRDFCKVVYDRAFPSPRDP